MASVAKQYAYRGAEHYTYRVFWSAEDGEYVGTVTEMPSLSHLAPERSAAFAGIQQLAEGVVAEMLESGETPPEALADRQYSGRFVLRVPPQLHRRLAMMAAEEGVSLNALVTSKLSGV